jgi:tetratricopeptide (TPR) repeat protein
MPYAAQRGNKMDKRKYEEFGQQIISMAQEKGNDAALDYLDDFCAENPYCIEAFLARAEISIYSDDCEDALQDIEIALEIEPDAAIAYYLKAFAYTKSGGDINEAIRNYSKAIELDPNEKLAYYNRGAMYFRNEEYEESLNDMNKAIEIDPEMAEAYLKRGILHSGFDDIPQAISDLEKFLKLDPDSEDAELVKDELKKLKKRK